LKLYAARNPYDFNTRLEREFVQAESIVTAGIVHNGATLEKTKGQLAAVNALGEPCQANTDSNISLLPYAKIRQAPMHISCAMEHYLKK